MGMTKEEVQELLGCEITDECFEKALGCALRKRDYIYREQRRDMVMQHWYLVKLTEEYVRINELSEFTADLCQMRRNMEKEHLTHSCKGAPTIAPIVSSTAL